MKKLKDFINLDRKIAGVNARNRIFVYPNNKRQDFLFANDKAITKEFLKEHEIPHPKTFAIIEKVGDINNVWESLSKLNELVIKPAKGRGGGGILVLAKENKNTWITPSGKTLSYKQIRTELANIIFGIYSFGTKDRVIIESLIKTHEFFLDIYPDGVPDIRLITYQRKIINIMLRIPTKESDGKANLHQGAIGVSVNMENGTLKSAYNYKQYLDHHPDTKIKITGLKIPYWEKIIEMSNKIAKHSPLLFMGIDIAIDKNDGPMVLEVNARPGIEIQNVTQKGLLESLSEHNL